MRDHSLRRASVVAGLFLALTGPVRGESIATESFTDGEVGSALTGLGGADDGWAGPWAAVGAQASFQIQAPSLDPGALLVDGREIGLSTTAAAANQRPLAMPLDEPGTIWFAVLAQQTAGDAAGTYLGVKLPSIGSSPFLYLGKPFSQANWGIDRGAGPAGIILSSVPATEQALLVARIDLRDGLDDVWVWVDPPPGREPALEDADVVAPAYGDFDGLATVRAEIGSINPAFSIAGALDEIRLGTTFASVAPSAGCASLPPECCALVCAADPNCCDPDDWDFLCALLVDELCDDPCAADEITLNTGWDHQNGGVLPIGSSDPRWTVVHDQHSATSEPRPATTILPISAWSPAAPGSQWISGYPTYSQSTNGAYLFETVFCLREGIDLTQATLDLGFKGDDECDAYLNESINDILTSVAVPIQTGDGFNAPSLTVQSHPLSTIGAVVGKNRLTIRVQNTGAVAMGLNAVASINAHPGGTAERPECCCNLGSIQGQKYNDLDCDGERDPTEPVLAGWTINLNGPSGPLTTTTDALGFYYFTALPPGTYPVTETLQSGWTQTAPASGSHVVTLTGIQGLSGLDFGNCASGVDPGETTCKSRLLSIYTWTFSLTNTTSSTATSLHVSAPNAAPNPVPLAPPSGLAPGATTTVTVTFCGAPGLPSSVGLELLDEMGAVLSEIDAMPPTPEPCDSCEVDCSGATVAENEPCWQNTVNPGCDVPPGGVPSFGLLSCGDVLCGTLWAGPNDADSDWSIVELADNDGDGWAQLCLTLSTSIPATMELFSGQCGSLAPLASTTGNLCVPAELCVCLPAPAKYKVRLAPGCPPCVGATGDACTEYRLETSCSDLCDCTSPPSGMIAWWMLDEIVPGNSADALCPSGGCGTDGGWIGQPIPVPGVVDHALAFDGVQDAVVVPPNSSLIRGTTDFTVDAWIRWTPPDNNVNGEIVTQDGYRFRIVPTGPTSAKLLFWLTGGAAQKCITTASVIPAHQWVHVTATLEQGVLNGCRLYVNGQLVHQSTPTAPNVMSSNGEVVIGRGLAPFSYFRGDIDEVELFDRALSQSEIQALVAAGCAGKCKHSCKAKWDRAFCANTSTLSTTVTVCNHSSAARTYQVFVDGASSVAGATCNGPALSSSNFAFPSGSTVVVPPGGCVDVPLTITRPAGLVPGQASCYDVTVVDAISGHAATCFGSVIRTGTWCVEVGDPVDCCPVIEPGVVLDAGFIVENTSGTDETLVYELVAMGPDMLLDTTVVSLDGLPPGDAVIGLVEVPAGTSVVVPVQVGVEAHEPFVFYDVLFAAEDDAETPGLEVISSFDFRTAPNAVTPPCPADLNGDGIVDGADLGALLASWGQAGAGDLNGDGTVDGADLGLLLGTWGVCG